jgi:hypothetical protein
MSDKSCSHRDAGLRCLVAHFNIKRELLPACIICKHCGQHIRPEDMSDECSELGNKVKVEDWKKDRP